MLFQKIVNTDPEIQTGNFLSDGVVLFGIIMKLECVNYVIFFNNFINF